MASLQFHCLSSFSTKLYHHRRIPKVSRRFSFPLPEKAGVLTFREHLRGGGAVNSVPCFCKANVEIEKVSADEEEERPPFNINLAVILAGFAFEAYTSPHDNIGKREVDVADCKTVYLSESFVREIYDGQLFIKLKRGFNFPAMDPWGTSDPYVVMQLDGQVAKSKTKWGTKEPTWNEELTFNIKQPPTKSLQIAAWDANLVTPHKRMGNVGISLERLCDGDLHEMLVELEGMGGGGKLELEVFITKLEWMEVMKSLENNGEVFLEKDSVMQIDPQHKSLVLSPNKGHILRLKALIEIKRALVDEKFSQNHQSIMFVYLWKGHLSSHSLFISVMLANIRFQVKYKSFNELDEEKKWWRIPFISELLQRNGFESAVKSLVGSESVPARQFVEYAFGQLKSFNDSNIWKDRLLSSNKDESEGVGKSSNAVVASDLPSQVESSSETTLNCGNSIEKSSSEEFQSDNEGMANGRPSELMPQVDETMQSDQHFWKNFADVVNQKVVQKLDLPVPNKFKWDGLHLLNRIGLQSRKIAEAGYIESGLATPGDQDVDNDKADEPATISGIQSSLPDMKKARQDLLRQTDSVLGALMVLTAAIPQLNKEALTIRKRETKGHNASKLEGDISRYSGNERLPGTMDGSVLDAKKAEEMKTLFSTAESAMEAWAMLATSLGHPSFIKSEFEKLCFLDNATTDTQVAIWRDLARKRLVVAFRGTEQARWKDLRTDLMLVPAGLNPERIGGDFKQEVQVHSGFLSAYDSVRIRIISLIKLSIGYVDDVDLPLHKWHVYVTGHSLGGALATLLALELASSQLAKRGAISVTMYNFGSPRVGNKRFAEVYNEKVKDSWRVVNHRDIIPTVPRLMGYCHVAQPMYLAAGDLRDAMENMELQKDGYQGDVIGESTPDVIVNEFMKGEKELIEKILQTEINIFRAIRDGSALMQHMEDFYYITLLENVRSNYETVASSQKDKGSTPIG